jgi:3-mercaptopyruvate sulfurtransferase SseA
MRKLIFLMMIASLSFVIACADAAGPPTPVANVATAPAADSHKDEHSDDAPRITLADAKKEYDAGTAIFVDTRPADSYKQEHVKGALNITAAEIEAKAKALPKDKKIIAYCS